MLGQDVDGHGEQVEGGQFAESIVVEDRFGSGRPPSGRRSGPGTGTRDAGAVRSAWWPRSPPRRHRAPLAGRPALRPAKDWFDSCWRGPPARVGWGLLRVGAARDRPPPPSPWWPTRSPRPRAGEGGAPPRPGERYPPRQTWERAAPWPRGRAPSPPATSRTANQAQGSPVTARRTSFRRAPVWFTVRASSPVELTVGWLETVDPSPMRPRGARRSPEYRLPVACSARSLARVVTHDVSMIIPVCTVTA